MSQVISWGFLHQKSSAAHAKDVEFLTSIASGPPDHFSCCVHTANQNDIRRENKNLYSRFIILQYGIYMFLFMGAWNIRYCPHKFLLINHKEREVTCTNLYSPGIISLTTPLDYESTKVYSLTVRATDVLSGSYGETKLQVNVLVRLANTTHMIEIDKRQIAHWSWTFVPWTFIF